MMPAVKRAWITLAVSLSLLAAGCSMHRLARTVGQGNGEVRASVGGPFFSNLGAAIPLPNLVVGGRYGATDGFDVDAQVSVTGMAYGTIGLALGGVGQLVREPRGFAMSLSGHLHTLIGVRGPDLRVYPELGLHLEGPLLPWLTFFGGVSALAQFAPPEGKPPIIAYPYLGLEALFGGTDEAGHPFGIVLEGGWLSPWQDSTSIVAWEPAAIGAMYIQLGFRARFGGLDR
jgi:hypothetical protein